MADKTDPQAGVAQAIEYLLHESGATRKQLAEYLGEHPSNITERLKLRQNITIRQAFRTAEFFGVPVTVLWMSEDELDEYVTPSVRRSLRQRVAVIDLTETGDETGTEPGVTPSTWTDSYGPDDLCEAAHDGLAGDLTPVLVPA